MESHCYLVQLIGVGNILVCQQVYAKIYIAIVMNKSVWVSYVPELELYILTLDFGLQL